jgi:hypothetical protein
MVREIRTMALLTKFYAPVFLLVRDLCETYIIYDPMWFKTSCTCGDSDLERFF